MKIITRFFSPILLFSFFCAPVFTYAMQHNNNNNAQQQVDIQSLFKTPGIMTVDAITDKPVDQIKIKRALVSVIEQRDFPTLLSLICTKIADNSLTPERIKLLLARHPQYLSCIDFNQLANTLNYKLLNELEPRDIIRVIKKDQFAQVFNCTNNAALDAKINEVANIVISTIKQKKQDTVIAVLKYEDFPQVLAVFLNTLAEIQFLPEILKSFLTCNPRYLPCIKFKAIAALLEKKSADQIHEQDILEVIDEQALAQLFNCDLEELNQKVDLNSIASTIVNLLHQDYELVEPQDITRAIDFGAQVEARLAFEVMLTYVFRVVKKVQQLPAPAQQALQNFDLVAKIIGYLDTNKAQAVFTKITNRQSVSTQELQELFKPDILELITQRTWINFNKLTQLFNTFTNTGTLPSELIQQVYNEQNIKRDLVLAKLFGSFGQAPHTIAILINKLFSDELDREKLEQALAKAIIQQQPLTHDDLHAILKPEWRALVHENRLNTIVKNPQALVSLINTLLQAQAISQEQLHAAFDIPAIERLLDLQQGSIAHALSPNTSVQQDYKTLTGLKQLLLSDKTKTALTMASGAALATSAGMMYQAACGDTESFCHGTAPTGVLAGTLGTAIGAPALWYCKKVLTQPALTANFASSVLFNKAKKLFVKSPVAPVQQESVQAFAQPAQSARNTENAQAQSSNNNSKTEPEQNTVRRRNVREQKQPVIAHAQPSTSSPKPAAQQQQQQLCFSKEEQDALWDLMNTDYQNFVQSLTNDQRTLLGNNDQQIARVVRKAQINPALLAKNSVFVHALDNNQVHALAELMGCQDALMHSPDVASSIKSNWRRDFTKHEGLAQFVDELDRARDTDARLRLLKRPYILALAVYNPQVLLTETKFIENLSPELRNSITNNI